MSPEELEIEKKKIEDLKLDFENKQKQMWAMSEAVYKEKKKIEEQLKQMLEQKEELETQKKENEEKVKLLWDQSIAIHKEKERINRLKEEVEEKHQEIIDSVNYAERIQHALLANENLLNKYLNEYFVFFHPRDIVSGDFYWAAEVGNNRLAFVAADSTGHGVPGAIMSILNISCLNEAVNDKNLSQPDEMLNHARARIMEHMANDGSAEGGKDGMDAVLACFDMQNNRLEFAAANNPLWLIRNGELLEYKPDKMPVGKPMGEILPFTLQQIELRKNDLIIMITDGFPDQFGGPKGKKFMSKNLKELLVSLSNKPMLEIKDSLKKSLDEWRGNLEQVDDVLVVGVRV
jgi:serine phosphatase RsbU (regulator of sigma subunit)